MPSSKPKAYYFSRDIICLVFVRDIISTVDANPEEIWRLLQWKGALLRIAIETKKADQETKILGIPISRP